MNEFQYNGTPQEQAMADLLKTQSHRLARQQIVFALIFLLVYRACRLLYCHSYDMGNLRRLYNPR